MNKFIILKKIIIFEWDCREETNSEAMTVTQVREDGGLGQGSSNESDE